MKWRIACPIQMNNYLYIWKTMLTLHQWFLHDFMGFCASYPNVFLWKLIFQGWTRKLFYSRGGAGRGKAKIFGAARAQGGEHTAFWLIEIICNSKGNLNSHCIIKVKWREPLPTVQDVHPCYIQCINREMPWLQRRCRRVFGKVGIAWSVASKQNKTTICEVTAEFASWSV